MDRAQTLSEFAVEREKVAAKAPIPATLRDDFSSRYRVPKGLARKPLIRRLRHLLPVSTGRREMGVYQFD